MATDLAALLRDLRDEQQDLHALVLGADLESPTPAAGWDVRDALSHLAGIDAEATLAASRPDLFLAALPAVADDMDGFLTGQLRERRGPSPEQLLASWQSGFDRMLTVLRALSPGTSVPWYGPPMSPASFVTARLMEYWAHGQDVADGLGVRRTPTARLRHIAHLGWRTRGFSYAVRGRALPPGEVRVALSAPDGGTWTYGDPAATDAVAGPAEDFCLRVTQRRHRDDTDLVATGPLSDEWLDLAQCFAGPPGAGRDSSLP